MQNFCLQVNCCFDTVEATLCQEMNTCVDLQEANKQYSYGLLTIFLI